MKSHIKIGAMGLAIIASPITPSIAMEVQGDAQNSPTHPIELPDINNNIIMSLKGFEAGKVAHKLSCVNTNLFKIINDDKLWKNLNSKEGIPESDLPPKIIFYLHIPVKVRLSISHMCNPSFKNSVPVLIETSNDKSFYKEIVNGRNDLLPKDELFSFRRKDLPLTVECSTAYHVGNANGHIAVFPSKNFEINADNLKDSHGRPLVSIRLFYNNKTPNIQNNSRFSIDLNYGPK